MGRGHGASGVSLFLLYLSLATADRRCSDIGRKGLEHDLRYAVPLCGALSWPVQDRPGLPTVPNGRYGSVGVASVALRYLQVTHDDNLRLYIDGIYRDAARKYAVFPGRFCGLAGVGDFLVDFAASSEYQSEQYLDAARRVANGIRLFQVSRDGCKTGFPGLISGRSVVTTAAAVPVSDSSCTA